MFRIYSAENGIVRCHRKWSILWMKDFWKGNVMQWRCTLKWRENSSIIGNHRCREWKADRKVTEISDIFGNHRSCERKIPVSTEIIDKENDELMDTSVISGFMRYWEWFTNGKDCFLWIYAILVMVIPGYMRYKHRKPLPLARTFSIVSSGNAGGIWHQVL